MQFAFLGAAGAQLPELVEISSSSVTNSASTSITFSSMDLGTPASDRYVLVVVVATDAIANLNYIASGGITIAGQAADELRSNGSSSGTANNVNIMVGFAWKLLTAGSSGDVVVTFNTTLSTVGSTMCRVYNINAPSGLSGAESDLDIVPDASGNMVAPSATATNDLALVVNAYEGADGQTITATHSSNPITTFWQSEVGTSAYGFAGKIYVSLNKTAANFTASTSAYTTSDSGIIYALSFLTH